MYYNEYGNKENQTLVMLHGVFFVDTFSKQYQLSEKYHIVVPHITGFGEEANNTFDVDIAMKDIVEICKKFGDVILIGFSLGAQLTFKVVSENPDLFKGAILISPWLVNKENISEKIMGGSLKMLDNMQTDPDIDAMGMFSEMTKEQIEDLVSQMQDVSEDTVRNSVDNNISLKTVSGFEDLNIPTMVIVGGKEGHVMTTSAEKLCALNENCKKYEIKRAKHNIPQSFSVELNGLIVEFVEGLE